MKKSDFNVIKGGMTFAAFPDDRRFIRATVTNTRLMGVMVLHIHWKYKHKLTDPDFHQFFYIDCEEDGIESYKSLFTTGNHKAAEIASEMSDCLGGKTSRLTKKETTALLQEFAQFTTDAGLSLPGELSEYSFLLKNKVSLSTFEMFNLMDKECEPVTKDNQLINYFILRSFGKDYYAIDWLSAENVNLRSVFDDIPGSTVHKNSIIPFNDESSVSENDVKSYFCETLIEDNGNYSIVTSEISVSELTVVSARKISLTHISIEEARLILNHSEFVTSCDLFADKSVLARLFKLSEMKHTTTEYPGGVLYTFFDDDNSHVCEDEFFLRNDTLGCMYITDDEEVLLAAFTEYEIFSLEQRLETCILDGAITITGKYEFQEPILYNFITSGLDSFSQFLEIMTTQT